MAIDKIAQLAVDIVINTARARRQLNAFHGDLKKNTKATRGLAQGLGAITLAAGGILVLRRSFTLFTDTILSSVMAFTKLEKQIVDVTKIAKVPIKELSQDFFKLGETVSGVSFQEISDTMSAAARLGIRGSEGLAEFTKTAVILSQVSGDISSTQAAEGIGRLVKNFNLSTDAADNLASSIDALSDAFPTTSGQILTFSARLAGLADASNIAAQDLNAFGAFMLSTGLSSTVSRTAFVKFFNILTSEPLRAAKALKLTTEEMNKLVELSVLDPIGAFELFAKKISQLSRPEQVAVLKELEASSTRLQQAIFNAAGSTEKLKRALEISNDAYETATQLIDKHAKVAGTADAKIIDLTKSWDKFKASLVDTPAILNTVTGALKLLENSLGGKGINFEEINLANTIETLDTQIKKTKDSIFDLKLEIERSSQAPIEAIFNILANFKRVGAIEQLEKKINILVEKRTLMFEKQAVDRKAAATADVDAAKVELENIKKVAAQREILGKQQLEDFLKKNEGLLFNPTNDSIISLQLKIQGLNNEFDLTKSITKEFGDTVAKAKRNLEDQIKVEKASRFEPLLGKAGQALNIIDQALDAIDVARGAGRLGMVPLIDRIADRQLENLFKDDKEPNQFVGLTEAWKKAQTAVVKKKEDPLLMEQIKLAKGMLEIKKRDEKRDNARNDILDLILKKHGDLLLR